MLDKLNYAKAKINKEFNESRDPIEHRDLHNQSIGLDIAINILSNPELKDKMHPEVTSHLVKILETKLEDGITDEYTNPRHLINLLQELPNLNDQYKANRWLGFIQGVMVMNGWLNVDEERNRTRPLFTGKQ